MKKMLGRLLDNKYKVIRLIGRGGMGTVYEAEHIILNRRVAIKVLLPMYSSNTAAVKRFIREGQAASAIEHPNIVDVLDFCRESDGTVYIVMELLKGVSLKVLLDQRGALPVAQVVSISFQVLSALQAAHVKGIIHRDLKPENIFLSATPGGEQVKIVDFGIAKFKEIAGGPIELTRTGSVPGTPNYLSPELASGGKNADERIDIWAMGVVLYEMLTGRVPFVGDNYNEVISMILMSPVVPVRELSTDVPEGLAQIVEKALAKRKEERFASADEMYEALLPFRGTGGGALRTTNVLLGQTSGSGTNPSYPQISALSNNVSRSSDSMILAMTDSRPSRPRRSVWTLLSIIAVIVSGAVGVVFGVSINDKAPPNHEAGEPSVKASPDPEPTVPPETPSVAAEKSAEKAAPTMVTIDMEGLPPRSRITVDGVAQKLPLKVARSDSPTVLKVKAPGYAPHEASVIPTHDRRLSINLKKLKPKGKRPKAKNDTKTKDDAKTKPPKEGEKWRNNPFAEGS